MENKLNYITHEYEGQIFKPGDCSPINLPAHMKYLVWKKDGDWVFEQPKMSSEVLKDLIRDEESSEIKEVLIELENSWGDYEHLFNHPEWYDSEDDFNDAIARHEEPILNSTEYLRGLNGSHRYFRYDIDL